MLNFVQGAYKYARRVYERNYNITDFSGTWPKTIRVVVYYYNESKLRGVVVTAMQ